MNPGTDASVGERPSTDLEALARLERFGGRALRNEMIALFLKSAPDRLAAAAAGVASGDAAAAENALHALKASAAQLGAVGLSRLCERGEAIAHRGLLEAIADVIEASRTELGLVEAWLEGVRAERPA